MTAMPLRVALLCDFLTHNCDARLFCRSLPRRRADVDEGEFVTEVWLIRLDEAGCQRMLEHYDNLHSRSRLWGAYDPCALLTRRVDIAPHNNCGVAPDGRETPWAWGILSFGSLWPTIFPLSNTLLPMVSHHPWHAVFVQVWMEFTELRERLMQVELDLGEDEPRRRAEAALEADLKTRKLWRKWQQRQLTDDEADAIIGPHRAAYHAEVNALKEERERVLDRITAIQHGQGLLPLEEAPIIA